MWVTTADKEDSFLLTMQTKKEIVFPYRKKIEKQEHSVIQYAAKQK